MKTRKKLGNKERGRIKENKVIDFDGVEREMGSVKVNLYLNLFTIIRERESELMSLSKRQ